VTSRFFSGSPVRTALIFLAVAALRGQQTSLARAPGAHILAVSPAARYSEPSIAVNPSNPAQVLVVYQGGEAVQGSANAAYSNDGARTFTIAQGTRASDWRVQGDVTTTFDNQGHAFLCYLAFDHLGTTSYWAHGAGRNGIFVLRSPDGGKTWEKDAQVVKSWPTGHEANIQFEDEPRIFADNSSNSRYAGNLYVGWVEWQLEKSVMLFSRSTDDGKTWSTAKEISVHAGLPRDDNGSLGGYVQAIGSDGTIYAIWDDGNNIVLTESHDGGVKFSVPRNVLAVGPPYFGDVPGVSRVEGFPQIAVDTSAGPNRGRVYVCWSDYSNGDVDVFLSSSAGGVSVWSNPVRVNNDAIHDGEDQFYQWMTVDPKTGAVYVMFYDRRDDPADRKTRVTLARSTDGGRTFENYAWTDKVFEGRNTFLGDYTWLAAFDNRVFGAWAEDAPPAAQNSQVKSAARPAQAANRTLIRVGRADFSAANQP
jgi:hypothetical protein